MQSHQFVTRSILALPPVQACTLFPIVVTVAAGTHFFPPHLHVGDRNYYCEIIVVQVHVIAHQFVLF